MNELLHIDLILPERQDRLTVPTGDATLAQILADNGLPLNTRCAGKGTCGGCTVELVKGTALHSETGERIEADETPMTIFACKYRPAGDLTIFIPARSLLECPAHAVDDFRTELGAPVDPLFPEIMPDGQHAAALAVDIGTTTVAVLLVDLASGKPLARASGFNKQMRLGDDVLTRIRLCGEADGNLQALQDAVVRDTLRPLLLEALDKANLREECVSGAVIAANTTMLHLFAGVDPTTMGTVPFTPPFTEHRMLTEPALTEASGMPIHLLSSASAYLGADITAGIVASGLIDDDGPSLLVDIGTNGEIVLKTGDDLTACSTAAGPAFEGVGLCCGVRATPGAIGHIRLADDPLTLHVELIQDCPHPAVGICGSAYVDLLAELTRLELATPTGRLETDELPDHWLLKDPDTGTAICLDAEGGKRVFVNEADIARLLSAKAAIAAGILMLLEHKNLRPADIKTLYLAGGFGMHLRAESAIGCGLLSGFCPEQVRVVGNTSLAGAALTVLDKTVLERIRTVANRIRVLHLNELDGFEDCYIEQMMLPVD